MDRLSYWRHGAVRMMCNKPGCKDRCDENCHKHNKYSCSFSIAFRSCHHTRIVDKATWLDPLTDIDRKDLDLTPLNSRQKQLNDNASSLLELYTQSGDEETFKGWLQQVTSNIWQEFFDKKK